MPLLPGQHSLLRQQPQVWRGEPTQNEAGMPTVLRVSPVLQLLDLQEAFGGRRGRSLLSEDQEGQRLSERDVIHLGLEDLPIARVDRLD